jgi:hypothetical protein
VETNAPVPSPFLGKKIDHPVELKEITELLIKHFDYHEGLFDLGFEFQIGVGSFGPDPSNAYPGIVLGIKAMGLTPTSVTTGLGVADAAIVNPAKKTTKNVSLL